MIRILFVSKDVSLYKKLLKHFIDNKNIKIHFQKELEQMTLPFPCEICILDLQEYLPLWKKFVKAKHYLGLLEKPTEEIDFILKPYDFQVLIEKIERLIE